MTASAVAVNKNETTSVFKAGGYTTYTMADTTYKWRVATQSVNGTSCPAMQGMNVGTTYIYTVKGDGNDVYSSVVRTNANTGEQITMQYYSSLTATTASYCNTISHGNEIVVCGSTQNGETVHHMFAATTDIGTAITRLKISGTGLYFTGYFDLVTVSGTSTNAAAIRLIKTSGGYHYFLIKRGSTFYYCKIAVDDNGGTKSSPKKVTIYKLFTIDTRNAVFATSNSAYSTCDNVESWTTQGFAYSKTEGVVYVPMWDGFNDQSVSIIITYNVNDVITDERLAEDKETSTLVYPTVTSFLLIDQSETKFEIESCDFRTGQGTDGDLKLYFNNNATNSANEGIYAINYKQGSGDFTPIVNEDSIVYTVKYNANGGVDSADNSKFTMNSTRHIRGITTRLRYNYFTKEGYTFAGWHLTRKSDGKWLYFTAEGNANWFTKGEQPAGASLALYEDRRKVSKLTGVNGDIVTCYAQWTPKSTGTKSFYIRYDANGGTGTMEDTKIVYGTSTKTRVNTFTREGYVFSGWSAHRASDNAWIHISATDLSSKWIPKGEDTTGYFLKSYSNGCGLSKTSSTDTDVITFYAGWTKIKDGILPSEITEGNAFSWGGAVESTTGLLKVKASVKDENGSVAAETTVNVYASKYELSALNTLLPLNRLAIGKYSLNITAYTMDASEANATAVSLADIAFTVVSPARLQLTGSAQSAGKYTLGDIYFEGFGVKTVLVDFKALFEYEIEVKDQNGAAVSNDCMVGTGYTLSCAGESRIAVLRGDINGDAMISALDYLALKSSFKYGTRFTGEYFEAADYNADKLNSALDCIAIKNALSN